MKDKPTIFLDRDGVINIDKGIYITEWKDFEFLPGSLELIKFFTEKGFRIIIVTNQSQIGKGLMTEADLKYIHSLMLIDIIKNGGKIEKIYHCPHIDDENCECRKPKAGMLIQAQKEFGIDFRKSVLIGNSWKGMDAGAAVGCTTCFLIDHLTDLHKCSVEPDFCIARIIQAKDLLPAFLNRIIEEGE